MRDTTARNLKPGMTVRAEGIDTEGTRLDLYRTIATNQHFAHSDNIIEFTDGTRVRVGKDREFQIADHTWCERCINGTEHESLDNGNLVHHSRIVSAHGINGNLAVEVSYIDGDREPQIALSGDGDFTPEQFADLLNVLQEQRQIMRAIHAGPAAVSA